MIKLDSKIPAGPLDKKWSTYKSSQNLVNPANKRKLDVIVVGTGLAGASAACGGASRSRATSASSCARTRASSARNAASRPKGR